MRALANLVSVRRVDDDDSNEAERARDAAGTSSGSLDAPEPANSEGTEDPEARPRRPRDAAPDAMVVDQDGHIVLLNLQAERQSRRSRADLVANASMNTIPEGPAERLIVDGAPTVPDAVAADVGTGIELTGRRPDGSPFPIEIMLGPLENDEAVLVAAAIREINARKQAQRLLAQMERRYRGLLEAAPDAMVVVNQDGKIVLLNLRAEKHFGYSREDLVGQPVTRIIPNGFAERLIADDLRSAADAQAQEIGTGIELVGQRQDGTSFPIEIMLSPLESDDGMLVTAAIRDITARKEAAEELRRSCQDVEEAHAVERRLQAMSDELGRSNRDLQDFASIASHDLQEPLRKIQAFGDRLVERSSEVLDDEAKDYVRRMQNAAERMQSLIDDLLVYSKVTTQPEPPQLVDLGKVAAEVVSDLEERIRASGGTIHIGSLPTIVADPLQMRQLLQNLIANALKFHAVGVVPEVHVDATERRHGRGPNQSGDHDAWEIRVRDQGIGFEAQHAERIFAPFHRLNGRQAYEGTGMGLAICRRIAALHGGTITASSQPGAGATFLLTLPRPAAILDGLARGA